MHLQPRAVQADPELWRARDEPLFCVPPRSDDALIARTDTVLHGMPADRLAMAASRWPLEGRGCGPIR